MNDFPYTWAGSSLVDVPLVDPVIVEDPTPPAAPPTPRSARLSTTATVTGIVGCAVVGASVLAASIIRAPWALIVAGAGIACVAAAALLAILDAHLNSR